MTRSEAETAVVSWAEEAEGRRSPAHKDTALLPAFGERI